MCEDAVDTQRSNQDWQNVGHQESAACHRHTTSTETHHQNRVLTSLGHCITPSLLSQVLKRLNPKAAPGVDHVTFQDFCTRQDSEIPDLVNDLLSRRYKCRPNRRVEIEKTGGTGIRTLGIPCFRDKLAGAGVKALLEPHFEEIFLPQSYGYRPGRSCHGALVDLTNHLAERQGGFIVNLDIRKFFDEVPHDLLMAFFRQKVKDPILTHAVWEFLSAGTLVRNRNIGGMDLVKAGRGTPQGGTTSPLLSNLYLHHVLDCYLAHEVSPSIPGGAYFTRYADDVVCVVSSQDLAKRLLNRAEERLSRYGLELNRSKSLITDFRNPGLTSGVRTDEEHAFEYLGIKVKWEQGPSGTWQLVGSPAEGRTNRAIQKARAAVVAKLKLGQPKKQIEHTVAAMVTGFERYFSTQGCREEVHYYKYEMGKLLESLRFEQDGPNSVDADLIASICLP